MRPSRAVALPACGLALGGAPGCARESTDGCISPARLRGLAPSRSELYNLTVDPRSTRDLSSERSSLAGELAARLDALRFRRAAEPAPAPRDPEQEKRLRALGYLQ
jgi:hypothetical protein